MKKSVLSPNEIFHETHPSLNEHTIKVIDMLGGKQSVAFHKSLHVILCHQCHLEFKTRRKFLIHLFRPLHLPKIVCLCQKAYTYTTFMHHWKDAEDCRIKYELLSKTSKTSQEMHPVINETVENIVLHEIDEIIAELDSNQNEINQLDADKIIVERIPYSPVAFQPESVPVINEQENTSIWSIFSLEDNELEPFQLPEEAVGRAVKNNFPDSVYTRKHLTENEERLFSVYEELCANNKDVKNPYTDSKLSNIPVNDVSVETTKRKWSQMIRIIGFDLNYSIHEVLWGIIRPKNIKLFINIAQQNKMSKKSMAHIAEYCYRMAWILNSKKFITIIQLEHITDVQMLSFYATLGTWYCKTIPWMISDAKRSTLQHRDLDSLKAQGKWEETETMIHLLGKLTDDINDSSNLKVIRNAAIYAFIVTTCPPRAQNLRLLLIPSGEMKTKIQIQDMVKIYNNAIAVKKKQAQCVSGAIFEDKSPDGRYNIVWTEFKTVKSFGIQTRSVSHPTAVKFFDLWLTKRDTSNNVLWQDASGKPLYKVGECFQTICRLYLKKNISISDYRIISTTKIKECGTNKEYLEFAHLCLHSESISDKHYVKHNVGKQQEVTITNLINVIGSDVQTKINTSCDSVKSFLIQDPSLVAEKINALQDFLSGWKPSTVELPETVVLNLPLVENKQTDGDETASPILSKSPYGKWYRPELKKFVCPYSVNGCRAALKYGKNMPKHILSCFYKDQPPLKRSKVI